MLIVQTDSGQCALGEQLSQGWCRAGTERQCRGGGGGSRVQTGTAGKGHSQTSNSCLLCSKAAQSMCIINPS